MKTEFENANSKGPSAPPLRSTIFVSNTEIFPLILHLVYTPVNSDIDLHHIAIRDRISFEKIT